MGKKAESRAKRAGIYAITHCDSLRRYIGQSRDLDKRLKDHRRKLEAGTHENPALQRYWNDFGPKAFTFFILEFAPKDLGPLALQRWLWYREIKHWKDASPNSFNFHYPEIVETPEAIREYRLEKQTQTREISKKIKKLNTLLERVKNIDRPSYEPIAALTVELKNLDALIWKTTGWRRWVYLNLLSVDTSRIQRERQRKAELLTDLTKKYGAKDRLRKEIISVRKELYNSYPGNREKRARRFEFPFRVYGWTIKRVKKTILY